MFCEVIVAERFAILETAQSILNLFNAYFSFQFKSFIFYRVGEVQIPTKLGNFLDVSFSFPGSKSDESSSPPLCICEIINLS